MELIIGTTGAAIILIFFVLNELHKVDRDSLIYDLGNLIGGGLLLSYAIMISSWPFAVLNVAWTLVALRDAIMGLAKKR